MVVGAVIILWCGFFAFCVGYLERKIAGLKRDLASVNNRLCVVEQDAMAAAARSRGVGGIGEHRGYTIEPVGTIKGYERAPGPSFPRG